jgi:asparagine synthase (glutamine-hydrolysing)
VLNGEIYNYADLRKELEAKGHRFYTRSDTEVIVHAYEEYGDDVPKHLRGMFGFALWDEKHQRLLLARDRVGKKPLLYSIIGSGLYLPLSFRPFSAIQACLARSTRRQFLTTSRFCACRLPSQRLPAFESSSQVIF